MGGDRAIRLSGDRIVLREFSADDVEAVHSYAGDPAVTRFLDWGPNSVADTRSFIADAVAQSSIAGRRNFDLAVVDAGSGALIGGAALSVTSVEHCRAAIGYVIHPDFWTKGYATEIARALLAFGFRELGLRRISATCHPDNHASARVLHKAGLQFEGRMRSHMYVRDEWRDSLLFAAIADDTSAG